ncbi:hypothetical protein GCM10018780_17110 [Streptomyces lanatus]|nr:hypothetical protein GCM10018780_17110 [Streptomyces lanatus]
MHGSAPGFGGTPRPTVSRPRPTRIPGEDAIENVIKDAIKGAAEDTAEGAAPTERPCCTDRGHPSLSSTP